MVPLILSVFQLLSVKFKQPLSRSVELLNCDKRTRQFVSFTNFAFIFALDFENKNINI